MNYPLLTVVLITVMLTACKGEGKPGQYPPSLYQEREGVLTDAELEKNKKQAAEKIYPADDPAAPHAKSEEELNKEKAEKAYPAEDAAAPRRGY